MIVDMAGGQSRDEITPLSTVTTMTRACINTRANKDVTHDATATPADYCYHSSTSTSTSTIITSTSQVRILLISLLQVLREVHT